MSESRRSPRRRASSCSSVSPEAVGDEEGRRSYDRAEGEHGTDAEGKAHDHGQEDRGDGVERGALAGDKPFEGETEFLRLEEYPLEEEEYEEDPSPHEKHGGALLNGPDSRRIAAQARGEGLPCRQLRRRRPDDEPRQNPADGEDGEDDPPGEEPPPCPRGGVAKGLGVDDGVVDAGNRLEKGEAAYDQYGRDDMHRLRKAPPRTYPSLQAMLHVESHRIEARQLLGVLEGVPVIRHGVESGAGRHGDIEERDLGLPHPGNNHAHIRAVSLQRDQICLPLAIVPSHQLHVVPVEDHAPLYRFESGRAKFFRLWRFSDR